jgi:Cupredoxin-like domain
MSSFTPGLERRAPTESAREIGALRIRFLILAVFAFAPGTACVFAGDEPVFTIAFQDGAVDPLRLEVPANRRFQLLLRNDGDTPAEFESSELHKEKVLAPKTTAVLVFRTLEPGEYSFFDDFHPAAPKAVLIAK